MKDLEDLALDYVNSTSITFPEEAVKKAFKRGVTFAQQWIKVEEELPTKAGKYLVKRKIDAGKEWIALETWTISKGVGYWENYLYVISWRPIELN